MRAKRGMRILGRIGIIEVGCEWILVIHVIMQLGVLRLGRVGSVGSLILIGGFLDCCMVCIYMIPSTTIF